MHGIQGLDFWKSVKEKVNHVGKETSEGLMIFQQLNKNISKQTKVNEITELSVKVSRTSKGNENWFQNSGSLRYRV